MLRCLHEYIYREEFYINERYDCRFIIVIAIYVSDTWIYKSTSHARFIFHSITRWNWHVLYHETKDSYRHRESSRNFLCKLVATFNYISPNGCYCRFPIWLIETWFNKTEFPRPFLNGIFEGFGGVLFLWLQWDMATKLPSLFCPDYLL